MLPPSSGRSALTCIHLRVSEGSYKDSFDDYYKKNFATERSPEKNPSQNASVDIMQKQRMLNQQHLDMKKLYSYNIIAHQPQMKLAPPNSRFNNSIKNSYSFETSELGKGVGRYTSAAGNEKNPSSDLRQPPLNGHAQPNY